MHCKFMHTRTHTNSYLHHHHHHNQLKEKLAFKFSAKTFWKCECVERTHTNEFLSKQWKEKELKDVLLHHTHTHTKFKYDLNSRIDEDLLHLQRWKYRRHVCMTKNTWLRIDSPFVGFLFEWLFNIFIYSMAKSNNCKNKIVLLKSPLTFNHFEFQISNIYVSIILIAFKWPKNPVYWNCCTNNVHIKWV